ncbi:MAG TPA: LLM class F420-dependent oxidoreductase [Candidatus Limnocylindrales bacterium]|nr:LLM class F420-dependent oxidoreductase [Candidatus Limnocylindrales bacterium]
MASRFGVFVPQGWKMDLTAFQGGPAKYQAMRRVALEAERLGYDGLWVYDHFHTIPRPAIEATFECWSVMAALAVETRRIRLGQMVTCNSYRPPALLAKMSSTVDVISNGRLEFGIGAGWYEHEYRAYGYPFPPVGERLRQLDEAVQLITAMWTQETATFTGAYYAIHGAINEPRPVQRPHPPIWIGGGGEKVTLRIVAQRGDASNFGGTLDQVRHKCEVLQQHCRDVGRDYDAITKSVSFEPVIIRATEPQARAAAERVKPAGMPSVDAWASLALIGSPEQCIERIRAYERVGISYFILYFHGVAEDLEPLRLFAEQVLPALRAG